MSDIMKNSIESNMSEEKWLYMDDERNTPLGYNIRTYTAPETIERLKVGDITGCSLDHDLGEAIDSNGHSNNIGDGYDVACWIEESAANGTLKRITCMVHSANPSGASKMRAAILSAERHWTALEELDQENDPYYEKQA